MIPLYKPFMPSLPLLNEILHSGNLAYGYYGKLFEKSLSDFIGVENVLTVNSFNMAILVTLTTLGIKHGDTVIASPMACLASTQPLASMDLNIKWADINPKTGTLCPDSVRKFMMLKPKAIFHNHFCGYVGFIDEINSIAKEYNIPVIDDCIEAFGSKYKDMKMGNTGTDVTIFSFSPVRLPNTIDGGAIVFKDNQLYQKSILVRDAGIDRKRFRDHFGEINPECDINTVGHSATMSEVNSYIGTEQMKHIDELLQKQRVNALKWDSFFTEKKDLGIPVDKENNLPNYWVYGFLTNLNKELLIQNLRDMGYYSSAVHINNNIYSIFKDKSLLPGVKEFSSSFLALPCGWWKE